MAEKLLVIDACVRDRSQSRTLKLCESFLQLCLEKNPQIEIERVLIDDGQFQSLNAQRLMERNRLVADDLLDAECFAASRQFAAADFIVIAAPYWDLSFPAQLKVYVENIMINKILFSYRSGIPHGLCSAKSLVYLATMGGYCPKNGNSGYNYWVDLAAMMGIPQTHYLDVQGLDVVDADVELAINNAQESLRELVQKIGL